MRFWSKLLLIAIAFGVLCAVAAAAAPPKFVITLHGYSPVGGPTCPYTESFTGTIHGPPGTAITYRFERSTGAEPTHSAKISEKGTLQVVDSWTRHVSGEVWQQLHILTPIGIESDKVTFSVKCPGGSM